MTSNDFLQKGTYIELVNVKDNTDVKYANIKDIRRTSLAELRPKDIIGIIDDAFEKNIMLGEGGKILEENAVNNPRFEKLDIDSRVIGYTDTGKHKSLDHSDDDEGTEEGTDEDTDVQKIKEIEQKYSSRKEGFMNALKLKNPFKGTIVGKNTHENTLEIIKDDEPSKSHQYSIAGINLRKIDQVYDIEIFQIELFDEKNKRIRTINIRDIKRDGSDIVLTLDKSTYKVSLLSETGERNVKLIKQKIKQSTAKMELGKLKYKLRWNYKTNYSGSKYFPLKVSNIKLLSESEKYSQIDKYTDLKEGDIVKYNDSSHKNYGLLAKVVSIGEDTRDARKYYETRKLYTITFEPFESYIPTAELKQYKRKYQNMEKSIANVSASKLLKFRFVEVFYYEKDVFDTVKDTGKKEGEGMDKKKGAATDETQTKLNKLNDFIVKNTLNTLKKNERFIPDYVLGKHQPEAKIDLNKLIKPNNKNAYIISHTPSIKKRPNGLYFDYAETKERGVIGYEINIYVDLTLFQSKVITQEEWDNKPLTEKLGNIFLDKIKNSEAGVFNCPSRWDKLKNILGNIKQGVWFSDIETSEPNLIKQSFKKNSEKISVLKDKLTKQEDAKKKLEQEIKEAQKSSNIEKLQKPQEKLQTIDKEIKETQKEIIQLEAVTSYKGGMKSRYTKKARKTRKKTKPLNKYIKVKPRKTRKCVKLLL